MAVQALCRPVQAAFFGVVHVPLQGGYMHRFFVATYCRYKTGGQTQVALGAARRLPGPEHAALGGNLIPSPLWPFGGNSGGKRAGAGRPPGPAWKVPFATMRAAAVDHNERRAFPGVTRSAINRYRRTENGVFTPFPELRAQDDLSRGLSYQARGRRTPPSWRCVMSHIPLPHHASSDLTDSG